MKLFAFAASHRKDSVNRKLVNIAVHMAKEQEAHIDVVEYGAFDAPIYDDETYADHVLPASAQKFVNHLQEAQGIIIASPEYNWSFPGSLKNIIDWASVVSPNPFAGKTALLLSASPSLRGGAQGLIQLRVPLEHLGMFVFPRIFALSRAETAMNGDGAFNDAKLTGELTQLVTEFCATTKALGKA